MKAQLTTTKPCLAYGLLFFIFVLHFEFCSSKKQLCVGAFLTVDVSAGGWSSEGVLPAIEMAVQDVNNDSTVLTEYELKMMWRDTKVGV